jgi:hypothetical protein
LGGGFGGGGGGGGGRVRAGVCMFSRRADGGGSTASLPFRAVWSGQAGARGCEWVGGERQWQRQGRER